MSIQIRRKLGTGARALEFMAANPFPTEPEQRVVLELKELVTRGEELLGQVLAGESGAAEASRQRRALVETLVRDLLRPLSVAGVAAAEEEPAVAQLRRVPSIKGSLQDIRVAAEAMAELASRHRDVLIRHGLSANLPDDLGAALAQFDAAMQQAHAGRRAHIGARAELADVGRKFTAVLQTARWDEHVPLPEGRRAERRLAERQAGFLAVQRHRRQRCGRWDGGVRGVRSSVSVPGSRRRGRSRGGHPVRRPHGDRVFLPSPSPEVHDMIGHAAEVGIPADLPQ